MRRPNLAHGHGFAIATADWDSHTPGVTSGGPPADKAREGSGSTDRCPLCVGFDNGTFDMENTAFALTEHKEHTNMKPKNTICLWFDKDAHEAAQFYAATFPDSEVTAVHEAPGDYPGGKEGDVLTVEFTVLGIPCLGVNGGPEFRHSEAFSFQIATDNQEETDRYWNAIVGNGGKESQCGWCKDRWSLSWQITPRALRNRQ